MLRNKQKCFCKKLLTKSNRKAFVIKKVKDTTPWVYAIEDLNGKEIVQAFHEQKLKKAHQSVVKTDIKKW